MPSDTPPPGIDPARHAQRLPRRIHRLRMLGMGLAALPIGMVLLENQAGAGHWGFLLFTTILWPQLALWLALRLERIERGHDLDLNSLDVRRQRVSEAAACAHEARRDRRGRAPGRR